MRFSPLWRPVERVVPCLALAAGLCVSLSAGHRQAEDGYTQKERLSRIHDLGKRKASAIPALSGYLGDPDREIRIEAVKAIVKIGGEDSLTPLVKATRDKDAEIQIRAVNGLVNFYLPGYVARGLTGPITRGVRQAKSVVSSRNDQVIDATVEVRADVLNAVRDVVSGGDSVEARIVAARVAGILRDRPAVPALAGSLHDHENALISESLIALQKIKDPSAGAAVAGVTHDLDERTQMLALETAGILRSVDAAPDIRSALTHARNDKVQRAALEALAMLGLARDRAEFQKYAGSDDVELRVAALEGLGRIREPEDVPLLERAYNEANADWRIHLAAAFALVNQGQTRAADYSPLQYVMENIQTKSRSDVASAYLAEAARRQDVRTALEPLISKTGHDGKLIVCSVLAESGSRDVEPILTKLTHDIDPDVATAAARALKTLDARLKS